MILRLPLLARSAESRWIADVPTARRGELAAALPNGALAGQARSVPGSQRGPAESRWAQVRDDLRITTDEPADVDWRFGQGELRRCPSSGRR